jgi:hypothetical protein
MGSGAGKGKGKGTGKGKGKGAGKGEGKGGGKNKGASKKKKEESFDDEDEESDDDNVDNNAGDGSESKNIFLQLIMVLQVLLVIGAVNMIVVQFVGGLASESIEFIPAAGRVYVIVFSVLVVLNEADLGEKLLGGSAFFANWLFRGFFYSYIGVVGLEQSSDGDGDLYADATAWYMLIGGMIYAGLGMMCLQTKYNELKSGDTGEEDAESVAED